MPRVTSIKTLQRDAPQAVKLTRRQEVFIFEYLKDFNGTRAAIAAGYSKNAAKETAFENLTKPHIKQRIDTALAERRADAKWTVEDIMRGIQAVARDPKTLPRDRLKAYELAGRHLGMYRDVVEHAGNMGLDFTGITNDDLRALIANEALDQDDRPNVRN